MKAQFRYPLIAFAITLFPTIVSAALFFLMLLSSDAWFAFLFSNPDLVEQKLQIWNYISLFVSSSLLMIFGWQLAKRATLPSTLFGRLWPLMASTWLYLLGVAILIKIFGKSSLNDDSSDLGSLVLSDSLDCFLLWIVFLIKSETRAKSTEKIKGFSLVLGIFLFLGIVVATAYFTS
jgi:uncharacterized membrane protein SirB2